MPAPPSNPAKKRHVKEGLAPGALALAAHAPAHGQAAHAAPGARRAQGSQAGAHERPGFATGDESGFCLQPTLGRCWQRPGRPPRRTRAAGTCAVSCAVTASWPTWAEQAAWGPRSSSAVETRLLPVLRRPAILVLDNGPCHRSRLVKAKRAEWRQRGLRLFFLPPYCPHLNRIETLWRLVKHHWLPVSAYASFAMLRDTVTALLTLASTTELSSRRCLDSRRVGPLWSERRTACSGLGLRPASF